MVKFNVFIEIWAIAIKKIDIQGWLACYVIYISNKDA